MANEILKYDRMVENALRGVVREALTQVTRAGLPGAHHFYITFRTGHPGVTIPEYLRLKFPQEMTIVLQYQFWGLEVSGEQFLVTLSFSDVHERLIVPFDAVTGFADPSVKFGLQFQANEPAAAARQAAPSLPAPKENKPQSEANPPEGKEQPAASGEDSPGGAKVVTLNSFRKK
ncbi:MAG: hypothetical protein FJX52_11525 [Alphaproteobacteria bacterium]|nr:hypothetical protein [Alphaproteobacteria bacterium]